MSLNDISLTAGMRANLVSLQQTKSLVDRTQQRLSTGKSVNSALDNPINYFAAQGHMSRASDIAGFKDNMSEAVQTIQVANQGITSLQGLIEAARSLGQSALSANPNQVGLTVNATVSGSVVTIGGTAYQAVNTGASTATQFNVQDDNGAALSTDEIASNLAAKINSNVETTLDVQATTSGSRITLQATASDKAITATSVASGGTISVDSKVTTAREDLATQYE